MRNLIPIIFILLFADVSMAQMTLQDGSSLVVGLTAETSIKSDVNNPNSTSDCYKTTQTLFANDENELVKNGDNIIFVASETIIFSDGFKAEAGSYMHAYIVTDYCPEQAESMLANENYDIKTDNSENIAQSNNSQSILNEFDFSIYPNPTNGKIYIDFLNQSIDNAELMLLDLRGQLIENLNTVNREKIEIDLTNLPKGSYMVVIKNSDMVIKRKIVRM